MEQPAEPSESPPYVIRKKTQLNICVSGICPELEVVEEMKFHDNSEESINRWAWVEGRMMRWGEVCCPVIKNKQISASPLQHTISHTHSHKP